MGKSAREQGRVERRADVERRREVDREARGQAHDPIQRLLNAPTALARLYAVRELRGFLDDVQGQCVTELRGVGVPWSTLGGALGVTGQAVSKRYAASLNDGRVT
jgi:hypothetical protein